MTVSTIDILFMGGLGLLLFVSIATMIFASIGRDDEE